MTEDITAAGRNDNDRECGITHGTISGIIFRRPIKIDIGARRAIARTKCHFAKRYIVVTE